MLRARGAWPVYVLRHVGGASVLWYVGSIRSVRLPFSYTYFPAELYAQLS